ncbi:hypothetical protein FLONG3_7524 [Fusarium longipes]|uniref:Uncharacterized protein n=1 Tax=Fusarium longipes TaxID=694270 RepID=A0A395SD54_9HYPO|nr:hypothetical protein FLONG3_7524 [Fusarium longipes]
MAFVDEAPKEEVPSGISSEETQESNFKRSADEVLKGKNQTRIFLGEERCSYAVAVEDSRTKVWRSEMEEEEEEEEK